MAVTVSKVSHMTVNRPVTTNNNITWKYTNMKTVMDINR